MRTRALMAGIAVLAAASAAPAERIKDITTLQGVRSNPLQGMGLVTGLSGTGDGSEVTRRAVASALRKQEGIAIDPKDINSKNVAVVWVTAELPPFARKGSRIDVTVTTIGSCESLRGGTLLMTELKGADGQVYAVGQGDIVVGGFGAKGKASSITQGFLTVGRIAGGAHVEREELAEFVTNDHVTFLLRNPDFATAGRIAEVINKTVPGSATAVDAGTVRVAVPKDIAKSQRVEFVQRLNALEVTVDNTAVVVINERTGTIIVGKDVQISTVAIYKANLSIIVEEKTKVSQPQPFSSTGRTEKVYRTEITAIQEKATGHVVPDQASVQDLARALNMMGLTPSDLVSIFMDLKAQGALQAELRIR